jgi:hypothetical protein
MYGRFIESLALQYRSTKAQYRSHGGKGHCVWSIMSLGWICSTRSSHRSQKDTFQFSVVVDKENPGIFFIKR